ncbi:hypothetical protein NHP21005_10860 [Helicobacter sp. NHP21005]|uniref:cache domain-containing protein n=1 Tax=Helicobacter felistomachi TaxID=3040201 RepID=UPI00336A1C01|nr:hypothetical protein NHP21005_10860 [Helicobacter sp. NHP21005]
MRSFSFSLGKQIVALWTLTIVLILVVLLLFVHGNREAIKRTNALVNVDFKQLLGDQLKLATDALAHSISHAIRNVPADTARKQIITDLLDGFRFEDDKSGYFFVYDKYSPFYNPNIKHKLGMSLENVKDKNGVLYVQELYKGAMKKGGFSHYVFPKPLIGGGTRDVDKIAYAQKIEGAPNWWIGTGVYMDNVNQRTQTIARDIENGMQRNFYTYICIVALLLLLVVVPTYYIFYRKITRNISTLNRGLNDFFAFVNYKDKTVPQAVVLHARDELGQMANALKHNIEEAVKHFQSDQVFSKDALKVLNGVHTGILSKTSKPVQLTPSCNIWVKI